MGKVGQRMRNITEKLYFTYRWLSAVEALPAASTALSHLMFVCISKFISYNEKTGC
ncbi:hypothetical protein J2T37_000361 [Neisseria perflava]|nr:hypothetical protein [Neisseria perflava]